MIQRMLVNSAEKNLGLDLENLKVPDVDNTNVDVGLHDCHLPGIHYPPYDVPGSSLPVAIECDCIPSVPA